MKMLDSLELKDEIYLGYHPLQSIENFNSLSSTVIYDIAKINEKEKNSSELETLYTELKIVYFQPIRPGSLRASVFCLVCVTLGSNMISLPYFFKTNGIILTLAVFFICMFATIWTLKILTKVAFLNKTYCYNELIAKYFGADSKMVTFSIVVLLINSLGSIILWNVFISQFLKTFLVFSSFQPQNPELIIFYLSLVILCFIQIPLATFKAVPQFYILSTLGIFQIVYVIFVLLIELPYYFRKHFYWERLYDPGLYYDMNRVVIQMPFVFINAFGNHSTILSVIDEIKNKTVSRVKNTGKKTVYAEMSIYLIVMFASYFSTFENTNESLFDRPNMSALIIVGVFLMMILMICNISLYYYMMLPLFESIFNNRKPFSLAQSFLWSLIVLTILTYISFSIEKVTSLLSFLGASAQISIIFIIPLSLYIKAKSNITNHEIFKCKFIIVFFSIAGMACFFDLFYERVNSMINNLINYL